MKILMILTSHDQLGDTGKKTGFWLEEFAAPYYVFVDAGADVTIASPKGGQPPLDPKSDAPDAQTAATRRFRDDPIAQEALANTLTLDEVDTGEFDALFYPGGHGPLWDLAEDQRSVVIIQGFYRAGKPVGTVCHAPAVFRHTVDEHGEPLVRGRKMTGFSNSEEEGVELTDVVPFLVEDMLIERGASYSKGDDWKSHICTDGLLITGQNPASSEGTARALLGALSQVR